MKKGTTLRLLNDPITYLPRYMLPTTTAEAEDYLIKRLSTADLFFVCQKHLPSLFEQNVSKEVITSQEQTLPDIEGGHPWSQGEMSCLKMISEHLFPFAYEYVEMVAEDERERMAIIPLHSFGIDLWSGSDLDPGWLTLAKLNREFAVRGIPFTQGQLAALKKASLYPPDAWSWEVFKAICEQCDEPLSHLVIALQMLDHATGNLFLDPTDEMPVEDATWTREDIELLMKHWQEAEILITKANDLAEWLGADPERLRKVVDLWNLAIWNMLMR